MFEDLLQSNYITYAPTAIIPNIKIKNSSKNGHKFEIILI